MFIIAGLGNPGEKYAETRHNAGFLTIDYLSQEHNIKVNKIKHKAIIGEGSIDGEKVILVKPQTFVNLSGESLRQILDFYKLPTDNLIVIYDDMSLDVGRIRVRTKGSDGGHNGMKSIIFQLGSDVFPRVRVGIGMPPNSEFGTVDFVLGRFSKDEQGPVFDAIAMAAEATACIVKSGAEAAMNKFNGKIAED